MRIERTGPDQFRITDGADALPLTRAQYEDLFHSIPINNGHLFRLLNDIYCPDAASRKILRQMVTRTGGVDGALTALQQSIQATQP